MADSAHSLARAGLLARAAPFAAVTLVAPLVALTPPDAARLPALIGAAALTALIAVAVALRAWRLGAVIAVIGVAFAAPVAALGGEFYPDSGWRRGAVWVLMAAVLGYAIQRLVAEIERQAEESRRGLDERLRAERRLTLESDVTRALADAVSVDEALPHCIDALGRGLGYRAALLWRPDAAAGELHCSAVWQAEAGAATASAAAARDAGFARRDGLPGRVWDGSEVEWVEDASAGTSARAVAARSDGLAAVLAVPIASERGVHGVIELFSTEPGAPDPDTVATASVTGSQIGQYAERKHAERAVFENAENIAAVLEATRELARSASGGEARAAICEAALKVSGGVLGALFEPDPDARGLVTTAARGEVPAMFRDAMLPFVGQRAAEVQAFASAEPLFVEDTLDHPLVAKELEQRGVRSCLYQPVLRDGRSVGVLMVAWGRKAARLSPRLADVLALLAAEAAVAIERADLLARLEAIARTDDLTGLANRRAWDELLPTELARAARDGTPLCVAMLDLDRFKAFNDEHGHQAGDRLLKAAAGAWRGSLRATDVLARYGGEEFAVVLPHCDLEDALALLARLRKATPEEQTVSAGIATWEPGESAEGLVARADSALYEAKNSGRNRVTVADPSETTV